MSTSIESRGDSQGLSNNMSFSLPKKVTKKHISAVNKNAAVFSAADGAAGSWSLVSTTPSQQNTKTGVAGMSPSSNTEGIVDVCGISIKPTPEEGGTTSRGAGSFFQHMAERSCVPFMRTLSLSSALRREENMIDPDLLFQLCVKRQLRRHDPVRGLEKKKQDYVYYNHRSKGCYIPRETQKDALTLTYNHMYNFADGTRFKPGADVPQRPNSSVLDMSTGRLKVLHKVSPKKLAENAFLSAKYSTKRHYDKQKMKQRRQESTRTISVDLARSLQVSQLRNKHFQVPIKIEDVIANDRRSVTKVLDGVSSVVGQGKIRWNDVPENLRKALHGEKIRQCAALDTETSSSAYGRGHHAGGGGGGAAGDLYAVQPRADETCPLGKQDGALAEVMAQNINDGVVPLNYSTNRQNVVFTDHADQILLGFTQNVCQPVTSKNGTMSSLYQSSKHYEEEALKETGDAEEINKERNKSATVKEKKEAVNLSPHKKAGICLLPPVSMAAIRDAERFSPAFSRKAYSGELPMPWTSHVLEKPLPFETSRLYYRRNYDVGDAKPPEGMVHISTLKVLR